MAKSYESVKSKSWGGLRHQILFCFVCFWSIPSDSLVWQRLKTMVILTVVCESHIFSSHSSFLVLLNATIQCCWNVPLVCPLSTSKWLHVRFYPLVLVPTQISSFFSLFLFFFLILSWFFQAVRFTIWVIFLFSLSLSSMSKQLSESAFEITAMSVFFLWLWSCPCFRLGFFIRYPWLCSLVWVYQLVNELPADSVMQQALVQSLLNRYSIACSWL